MRLYAICCFIAAVFYCGTAVQAMWTGAASPLRGDSAMVHRREDPASSYGRYLFARWLLAAGLVATGVMMSVLAGRFEKLENANPSK